MKFVLATNHLGLGGSETYLITVAEQLDRLGHEVVLHAHEPGAGLAPALERGLSVVDEEGLPPDCDAALVQDGSVSHRLAASYPEAPQLFVAHSESFDLQAPPQLDGAVGAIVALNDRVAERMRSYAVERKVVRLRQPIDTERFLPRGPLPAVARRALLLSNTPHSDRLGMLRSACEAAGLELVELGGRDGQTTDPRPALAGAEIVIGYGRSILEAMACGRAAYVYDWHGCEGWMTASSYPEIEADGIAGRSGRVVADGDRIAADLRRYEASMGPVNHDLVIAHHRANVHAQQLVALFRDLGEPAPRPRPPLREMARLVRLEWRARVDSQSLTEESYRLREQLREQLRRSEEQARAGALAAQEVEERLRRSYEGSRSWRLTAPLRAVARAIRRRRS